MKKSKWLLFLLAVVLVLTSGIGAASAYFTTYATARGGYVIRLGERTEIEERVDSGKKIITIKNNDDSDNPVFVRVSAYAGSAYPLTFTPGDGWVEDTGKPGFWRYTKPVLPGKSTDTPLTITIDYGSDHKADEHFNVIVVHESVPALYVDDHYDIDASWSLGKVTVIEEGGSQS